MFPIWNGRRRAQPVRRPRYQLNEDVEVLVDSFIPEIGTEPDDFLCEGKYVNIWTYIKVLPYFRIIVRFLGSESLIQLFRVDIISHGIIVEIVNIIGHVGGLVHPRVGLFVSIGLSR